MHQVKDDIETIHLYVVREGQKRPSLVPVIISILTLSILIALSVLIPYQQPEERRAIRIPAVLLPLKTFSAAEPVIAPGIKIYPATTAHGTFTLTNGSVIAQQLPAGLIFTGADGVEVTTDSTVFVPAGSASGYGIAYVSAHAVASGSKGNIPTLDIDSVEGSSVYIRNLRPFTGGQDAYSVKFVTQQDKQEALNSARSYLSSKLAQVKAILETCRETIAYSNALLVTWNCRFVAYPHLLGFHINRSEDGRKDSFSRRCVCSASQAVYGQITCYNALAEAISALLRDMPPYPRAL